MFRTHPTYLFHTSQPHRLPNTECEEVIGPQNPISKRPSQRIWRRNIHRSKLDDSRWLKFLTWRFRGQPVQTGCPRQLGPGESVRRFGRNSRWRPAASSHGRNNFRGVWMYPTKSLGALADVWYSMTKTCFFKYVLFVYWMFGVPTYQNHDGRCVAHICAKMAVNPSIGKIDFCELCNVFPNKGVLYMIYIYTCLSYPRYSMHGMFTYIYHEN